MIEVLLPPLQRAALQIGTLVLVGTLAWKFILHPAILDDFATSRPEEGGRIAGELEGRVTQFALGAALLVLLSWPARMAVQLIGFRDPFVPLREDVDFLLRNTFWGTVWIAQGGVLVVLVLTLLLLARSHRRRGMERGAGRGVAGADPGGGARANRFLWPLAGFATAALVLTLALSSHALSVEGSRTLAVGADALHTLTAGGWIGTLALVLALARRDPTPEGLAFRAQLRAFSPMALLLVPLLVLAGSTLTWHHLSLPGDLLATSYGRVLSAKLALVGIVLLLGFLNWRRGMPDLERETGRAGVRRRAAWELLFAGAVLLLTALLTGAERPGPG